MVFYNMTDEPVQIQQTKQWVKDIIIDLNFCPFAKKEWVNNAIHYHVSSHKKIKLALIELIQQFDFLEQTPSIETSLLIFDGGFSSFQQYLTLVDYANDALIDAGLEGVFQLATFHPDYCFEGADYDDAENYTNRSPYPIVHILREASLTRSLSHYKNPEEIPENNILLANKKGKLFFETVLKTIKQS